MNCSIAILIPFQIYWFKLIRPAATAVEPALQALFLDVAITSHDYRLALIRRCGGLVARRGSYHGRLAGLARTGADRQGYYYFGFCNFYFHFVLL